MKNDKTIELGDVAKDTLTGFKGIVVGVTKWLHGCRRIVIQPQELKDGKPIDPISFDEPQVECLKPKKAKTTANTGGPAPEPMRRATPRRR